MHIHTNIRDYTWYINRIEFIHRSFTVFIVAQAKDIPFFDVKQFTKNSAF